MANSPSAIKRARTNIKRRDHNRSIKSKVRTLVRNFDAALDEGNVDKAKDGYNAAASALDKAASKGVVHKNEAARRKARMATKLNRAANE